MANKASTSAAAHVSAELRDTISALLQSGRGKAALTLHDVRLAVQGNNSAWTQEGELLHPQDRTALLIEIDDLIDRHGKDTQARKFLPAPGP
jgi:hypothetical protein